MESPLTSPTMAPPPPTDETTRSADHLFHADSDSDSESGYDSDDLTDVQLGLSDGPLEAEDDSNPLVSRIGGRVAWLPTKTLPPASTSECPNCHRQMELLLQIFAPLEGSAYDRLLLIWGCARAACQRQKKPSLRAIRILQHNKRWAAKLEKQKAKAEAREAKKAEREAAVAKRKAEEQARAKQNPFAAAGANKSAASGGLGGALFGGAAAASPAAPANPFAKAPAPAQAPPPKTDDVEEQTDDEDEEESEADEDDVDDEDDERLAEETAIKASLEESAAERAKSDWAPTAPAYLPAQYLNTIPEPSAAARAAAKKLTAAEVKAIKATDGSAVAGDNAGLQELEKESYERMMVTGVDATFEHFVQRVKFEGRQVVRYRFGGEPLPYNAQGETYEMLWPKRKTDASKGTAVTRGHLANASPATAGREYDASPIPPCPSCGSPRTFEAQLMPNLINLLRPAHIQDPASEAAADDAAAGEGETAEQRRRREIEEALGRALPTQPDEDGITRTKPRPAARLDGAKKVGLNFGTAMVFVCERDCAAAVPREGKTEGEGEDETWREEFVAVQWED